ncbi:serine hydrolase domain-containing protein [Gulosibacter molinativorax]|uniref:Beta-lactamase-related domain-containing protein n=1 Tax=Gulosibacter molinativorax TaxID=256821 RepID=A0ABT7C7R1_9MICO|nr:serine hydrolase domain-containing protein [Gulosibacter molinativorax]MDJ1370767.1 hypothetical protein [Gulosibacter molinativorax]QUY63206.1 Hypotetical protein [Gulosibacter molinativorax]
MTDFSRAIDVARRRGGPAHLLVLHEGTPVVDERFGVGAHAAFWPFSVSKIYIAALTWALHEDGLLSVDHPVAKYWPEFAQHGKEAVTIRQVLQHRSGLPRVGGTLAEVAAMTDWREATDRLARASRQPNADEVPAYEWLAWGFILGEVAQRTTGFDLQTVLRERILERVDARGTFLGMPPTQSWRAVPFTARDPASGVVAGVLNRESVRDAVIPAGGVSTTVYDLANLLEAIRLGGSEIGLGNQSTAAMLEPSNHGEFDRFAGGRVWWSNGLQLGHADPNPFRASALGTRSSDETFGHNGSNVSIAWADPTRDLTFVYLSGIIEPFPLNRLTLMRMQDLVLTAVGDIN